MKIAILTLHLYTNYGGILQAYALKEILERMGNEVTLVYRNSLYFLPTFKLPLVYIKRLFLKYILFRKDIVVRLEHNRYQQVPVISKNCADFMDNYIPSRILVRNLKELKKNSFDAFVVGSDQIWRPKYFRGKIEDSYLGFAIDWNVKRISYAASFGTDEWEYSINETKKCAELIKKFDAVSVREISGISLCSKYLGMDALHVLDPTLLLNKEDYQKIINARNSRKEFKEKLFNYILDPDSFKMSVIEKINFLKNIKPFEVHNPLVEHPLTTSTAEERIQPPLEDWLQAFDEAEYVVTDSFHATVFSIIFNKPFIVIGNQKRGMARFASLLNIFDLEDRLVTDTSSLNDEKILEVIDWVKVNTILEEERRKSYDFLKINLA